MVGPPQKLSPTQLFKGLMLSSAAITGRLDNLEDRGLVTRSPDPADRRGVIVELTEKGCALVDAAVAANTPGEAQLLNGLTEKDRQSLARLLRQFLARLKDAGGG